MRRQTVSEFQIALSMNAYAEAEAAQFLWDGSRMEINEMARPIFGMDLFETSARLPEGPV